MSAQLSTAYGAHTTTAGREPSWLRRGHTLPAEPSACGGGLGPAPSQPRPAWACLLNSPGRAAIRRLNCSPCRQELSAAKYYAGSPMGSAAYVKPCEAVVTITLQSRSWTAGYNCTLRGAALREHNRSVWHTVLPLNGRCLGQNITTQVVI